jgi:hypothetical protein
MEEATFGRAQESYVLIAPFDEEHLGHILKVSCDHCLVNVDEAFGQVLDHLDHELEDHEDELVKQNEV